MDFIRQATDDQLALMGCAVALAASAVLLFTSGFFRTRSQQQRSTHRDWGRVVERTVILQARPDADTSDSQKAA